jgi:hypothetical protein
MGVSTNGVICYGIKFEEGQEFPWDAEPWEGAVQEWWRDVNGYKPPFELYDQHGNYHPSIKVVPGRYPSDTKPEDESLTERYYAPQRAWDEAHPVPVELENYCSDDCPMYILSVPAIGTSAERGYPEAIKPHEFVDPDPEPLLAFCRKYKIRGGTKPKWWLCSYWG